MDLSLIQPLLDWLQQNPDWLAASIFIISFAESLAVVGLVVPGVVLLFGIAAIAGNNILGLTPCLIYAGLGAVLGDGLSFLLGRAFQHTIKDSWPFKQHPRWLASGEKFFRRHGGTSIFIGRFVGPMRPFMPITAGMLNMYPLRFFIIIILSASLWAPVYIVPGFIVGASLDSNVAFNSTTIVVTMVAVAIACLIYSSIASSYYYLQPNTIGYLRARKLFGESRFGNAVWQQLLNKQDKHQYFPLGAFVLTLSMILLFSFLTISVLSSSWLMQQNIFISQQLAGLHLIELDQIFIGFTLFGDFIHLLGLTLLICCSLIILKQHRLAFYWLLAMVISISAQTFLKDWFTIARPQMITQIPNSYSYPSGHALVSTVFISMLLLSYIHLLRKRYHWAAYTSASIVLVSIASSRVYLGVHWLSDILAGLSLGLAISSFIAIIYQRKSNDRKEVLLSWKTTHKAILLALCIIWSVSYFSAHHLAAIKSYAPL